MDSKVLLFLMGNHLRGHFNMQLIEPVSIPGILRVRFAGAVADREIPEWRDIAVYDIDRDPQEVAAALLARYAFGNPAFDDRSLRLAAAYAITPRLVAEGALDNGPNPLLFVVLTNPVAGRDDEYNDWYDRRHIPDVLAIPGFVAAQRFRVEKLEPIAMLPWRYLAIYEVAAGGVEAAFSELDVRKGTERMPISDALANERFRALYAVTGAASS